MNKNQVKGTIKDAVGKVQEATGKAVGSAAQELHGIEKQGEGKGQKASGDIKQAVKDGAKR